MNLAKKDTAKTFLVGPILDFAGVAKTDEVVASIKVTKNGTVGAVDAQDTLTHNHTGHYVFVSDGGDFDTFGEVEFSLNSGTNAMAPVKFQVITATVYDAITSLAMGAALGFTSVAAGGAKQAQTVDLTAGQTIAATVAGGATESKQDTAKTVIDNISTAVITNAAGVDIAADIIAMKAETALIVADTNELQTDWTNGGRLDLLLDVIDDYMDTEITAIKAKTDLIPATPAATGDIPTTAQIKTAIEVAGSHLALIKAKTDTIPTDPATEATLAKVPKSDGVATWNATALGSIQSECMDALNAYDPPTKMELDIVFSNNSSLSISFGILIERIYQILNNKMNVTDLSGAVELRNINDSGTLSTSSITDNLTTTIRDKFTW